LIYTQLTKKHLVRLGKKGQEATVGFYQVIHEGLSGVKEVKVLEAESFFMRLFKSFTDKYKKNMTHVAVWQIAPKIMIETLIVTMVTGYIFFAYLSDRDIAEILPLLGVFGVAFMRLYPSFNAILSSISSISAQKFSLDILYDELKEADHKTTQTVRDTQETALAYQHSLELKGLHYRYPGSELPALKDINLTISPGESIGIVGKSGSGKTTLADVILGLLHYESGEILLDGINVFREISKWHGMLGYIPQNIFLLNDTIQQNITFGVHEEDIDHEALNNAIISAQLQELIEELPKGVLTVVGERGVRLSGGQRQRIGIARALYRNPKILVLDEATSALDNETEAAISKAIETISHNKTLIIIAHRLSTVKNCDRLYLIDNGKIISHGSYQELINKNEWFKKVNDLAATQ
ncbi:MAG: ABC transporter ATP-binding protein, partial [Desulfobacterales bacterium]|nr:ABC transporter ATP-binding protein [Desulfobacterales bacterium]